MSFKQRPERIQKSNEMIASVSIGGGMRPLKGSGAGVVEPVEEPTFDAFPLEPLEGTDAFFFSFICYLLFMYTLNYHVGWVRI